MSRPTKAELRRAVVLAVADHRRCPWQNIGFGHDTRSRCVYGKSFSDAQRCYNEATHEKMQECWAVYYISEAQREARHYANE